MRIRSCTIYAISVPFVETFSHSAKRRARSDSVVVRLEAWDGSVGYGEGAPRRYVTGETTEASIEHIRRVLWPAVAERDYEKLVPCDDPLAALADVHESLPVEAGEGVTAFNAARSAVEVALLDCLLHSQAMSLAEVLPPRRASVTYGAVVSSGSTESCVRRARRLKLFGMREVKIKIREKPDVERVRAVREVMGREARLRVDANGAFQTEDAVEVAKALAALDVAAFEQPTPRRLCAGGLSEVRRQSKIPVMADESLITEGDARALIGSGACDYFNLRVSKCGGIAQTLKLARMAQAAGVRLQLGSQVGETAILSAAGRHLAAHLESLEFVEGSYGKLLLAEDLSREAVQFGHAGRAPILRGPGLGVRVREEVLARYALQKIQLGEKNHA